jgi:hypothetical protein
MINKMTSALTHMFSTIYNLGGCGSQVVLDVSTPILGRLIIEGTLIINDTSVNLTAVYMEIKGGNLIIASTDQDGRVTGPYNGNCTITMLGTNDQLSRIYGPDPRKTPTMLLGNERIPHASAVIGVFGYFTAIGKAQSYAWLPLAAPAMAGNTSILLDGVVDWPSGSEVVISPTDLDPHEAEISSVKSIVVVNRKTEVLLTKPLALNHYSEEWVVYGTKKMRMQGKVGLLTRNIVIRGQGEGESRPYTTWNLPKSPGIGATPECGNGECETGETLLNCQTDCFGPMYEYGTSILVSAYSEDFTSCTKERVCTGGYRRSFSGALNISNVELKYYGQNNLRNGIVFSKLADSGKDSIVQNISFNRGYFGAVLVEMSSFISFRHSLFYRAFLPCVEIKSGSNNTISGVLGIVGIFWNTHRGAKQVQKIYHFSMFFDYAWVEFMCCRALEWQI